MQLYISTSSVQTQPRSIYHRLSFTLFVSSIPLKIYDGYNYGLAVSDIKSFQYFCWNAWSSQYLKLCGELLKQKTTWNHPKPPETTCN